MTYKEDNLQIAVAQYLDALNINWFHPANERKTSPQAGARLKRKGVKSGVPDIMIIEPKDIFNGLAIELKVKPNKPSKNQKEWFKKLEDSNWLVRVCYSFDEAKETIDKYLK